MLSLLGAAVALGLFGGLHCALMCGPLAVAGCRGPAGPRASDALRYHAGRLCSYALLGALFGTLGAHAAHCLSLDVVQRVLVALVAVAAIGKGVLLIRSARRDLVRIRTPGSSSTLPAMVGALLPRRGLGLGLATGVLPCGMLAAAWALAAASGHPVSGAGVMAVFCAATAPALVVATLVTRPLDRLRRSPALAGMLWCALGVWMGFRPLIDQVVGHVAHHAHGGP